MLTHLTHQACEDDHQDHQVGPQDINPEVVIGELCCWARPCIQNATLEQVIHLSNTRDLLSDLDKDIGDRLQSIVDFL
eukprot:15170423-Ditylum_brightwellii.AAC.1